MEKSELIDLTIGSFEDYKEVQNGFKKLLHIEDKPQLNKYKVSKTAKSKSNGIFYNSFHEAMVAEVKQKSGYHIYKAEPTKKGIYWKKVY